MEENKKQYLSLLSEIIAKESIVLGPEIAILKARKVASLVFDVNGNVVDVNGYLADTVKGLVDEYAKLSSQATKNIIDQVFAKYPQIKRID